MYKSILSATLVTFATLSHGADTKVNAMPTANIATPTSSFNSATLSHGAEAKVNAMPTTNIVTKTSSFDFATTIAKIKAAVAAKQLTLFATIDHSGKAQAAGLQLAKTQVLIFGSPVVGTPLMQKYPQLALDLPFRVLVAAADNGKTLVSYHPSSSLAVYGLDEKAQQQLAGLERLVAASIANN